MLQNFETRPQILCPVVARFYACSSSSDNLEALVVHQINSPRTRVSEVEPILTGEFEFMRDTLLCSHADSVLGDQKIVDGESSSDTISVCHAIRNNGDDFGDKTQKYLRKFRDKLNENFVVSVLRSLRNLELSVKFFTWAGRQIGYGHTGAVYNALLEVLRFDKPDRLEDHLLQEIANDDKEVLGKLLNFLIQKCCRNGLWNLALEELGRLKDFGYKPTRATYNALIHVFLKAGRLDTACLVHREMSDAGFSMNELTLGSFAYSLCKAGRWKDALSLIESENIVPDTIIYTKMISGLCEASLFEVAMEFLNQMRAKSCMPNVITYRILLCGCLRRRKLGRCKHILSMMMDEGCNPSRKIFNSLVGAYCKSGDYSYAYKLLTKMEQCSCQPGYVVYNILIGALCGNGELPGSNELELAEQIYSEMLASGIVLNKINVSNFAWCLCGVGKFEKAHNVISEMMSKGFVPDTSTYSKVIGFLCNKSKVEQAFSLFEEMKKNRIAPDVFTYTILIDSFCKAGLIEQAGNWFDEMVRTGCKPSVVTYTALIHAYLKAKKVLRANELFEMMLSDGCLPNIVTYTALIDGHCKIGEIGKACQIYVRMRGIHGGMDTSDTNMYFDVDSISGIIEPNVFTYGALVDGLCKAHKVKEAQDLLDAMLAQGCKPNHIVYDALIDGFCKVGKLDEAQEVFSKMSENGYSPNVYTFSSLVDRLFKDKRLDLVLKVLARMLENSCPPNVVIYTEMVDGLCKVGKVDEAYKLMLMMEGKGCLPNVVTYTAMIDGFGKVGRVERCLELFEQMCSKGCAPNFITYQVLIKHCCATGYLDEAHNLLEEMKQTHWPKHVASHKKVIEGFNRDFILSLGILDDMRKQETLPVIPTYKILIDSFHKAGRLEVALELHKEMLSSSSFSASGNDMHFCLIESLCLADKVDAAFEMFADMMNRGSVPELSLMFYLIKGLIQGDKWEAALLLSDSICQMAQTHYLKIFTANLSDPMRGVPQAKELLARGKNGQQHRSLGATSTR